MSGSGSGITLLGFITTVDRNSVAKFIIRNNAGHKVQHMQFISLFPYIQIDGSWVSR